MMRLAGGNRHETALPGKAGTGGAGHIDQTATGNANAWTARSMATMLPPAMRAADVNFDRMAESIGSLSQLFVKFRAEESLNFFDLRFRPG
ncbi:hypothetical protein SAMN02745824_1609 [Parasphingorhabdus marina DSM 22363]|uniref:Uncharacterized protein n=1 Tax=Parasphingorhabdus marina DSM 22363 TaxID=1123272 RepID=A0A1N6D6M0_9SPHN|nr:hypothetical protein SAMN02745824_1609 [Parasphingorhabdus marina DSM 22363]